jgi:hypothetical protein
MPLCVSDGRRVVSGVETWSVEFEIFSARSQLFTINFRRMPAVLTLLRIKTSLVRARLADGRRFIAVTGETGAGKSIIIGALQLLLGDRADKSLIRTGAAVCTVRQFSAATICES